VNHKKSSMKNKTMLFAMVLFLFNLSSYAQVEIAKMSFEKSVYQFGTVAEDSGDINIKFEFSNSGSSLLQIDDITADKGIEVLNWPKSSVKPGEKGTIEIVFHPNGNPNRIYKKIKVYSNAQRKTETLSIVGNVTPIPGSVAALYTKTFTDTDLRLKTTYVNLGNVTNKQEKSKTVEIVNDGDTDLTVTFDRVPDFLVVTAEPKVLKAHEEGKLNIVYKAGLKKKADGSQSWGAQNDRFYVVLNDEKNTRNFISVRASITEDFVNMTDEEKANAPKAEFKELVFDFGTIKQGEVVKHDFTFKNLGENDLEIRHVKAT